MKTSKNREEPSLNNSEDPTWVRLNVIMELFMSYLYCVITDTGFLAATIFYWIFCGLGMNRMAELTASIMTKTWDYIYYIMIKFHHFDHPRECVEFQCTLARYWFWYSVVYLFVDFVYLFGYSYALIVCAFDWNLDPLKFLSEISEPFHRWFERLISDLSGIPEFVCPYITF